MVYYAIALALYMTSGTREVLRCLLEGLRWLWGAEAVKVAGKSGISQARSRLGEAPLQRLYGQVVGPIATRASKGAWYRGWRLVSLDGSCLDVADTEANRTAFGCPGASRGESAFPQFRFVALVENGTHVLFGARLGGYAEGETTLAHAVLAVLQPGMLCLADRQFFGYALWRRAAATGADLLLRGKHNLRLPREAVLADGSYLTTIYPSDKDRRHRTCGLRVRVVEYRLDGIADAEPLYRLVTTILDPAQAPAAELAALYHERWEIEGALAELKTQLRGARGRAAQQDTGVGPAGVLGAAAGAFRGAWVDARSGVEGRRGSGPAVLLARGARGPPQGAAVRGASPLGTGPPCMRRCWRRSWRSAR